MINEGYDLEPSSFPAAGSWNPQYTYENINLWGADAWKDKYSPICTLAQWIEQKNAQLLRNQAKSGIYDCRTDGIYEAKTCSLTYPDVVEYWNQKGLFYKCTEMGGVCWIAMIPHEVCQGKVKDPRVLVVLHDADYSNPNWAMETITTYGEYNNLAAREGLLILYVVVNGPDENNRYIDIMQELSTIYHLKMDHVYMDLSTLKRAGCQLSEIQGLTYPKVNGLVIPNPEETVEHIGSILVLPITGIWQNRVSLLYRLIAFHKEHPAFDVERHIHSACGRKMADGMRLENQYITAQDPNLLNHFVKMGLHLETHTKNGAQWLSLAPLSVCPDPNQKLPVMLIFQEVSPSNPFSALLALSCHYEYCDLVAQGQLICLFFALETPDDNDLFMEILQDAAQNLPIDLRRVYLTGHSHNGHFASEFMRRHPRQIAAVATLGNSHGLLAPGYSDEVLKVTDEMVDLMTTFDVPLINIIAITENAFVNYQLNSQGFKNAADSWQRRLKAFNCPMKNFAEIATARTSPDLATRMIGVPNDGSQVRWLDGCECYIADVKNNAGESHLRLVTLENTLHMPTPQMPGLAWDFVRRFARDLQTGAVVELF